jgi:hypothetical protein
MPCIDALTGSQVYERGYAVAMIGSGCAVGLWVSRAQIWVGLYGSERGDLGAIVKLHGTVSSRTQAVSSVHIRLTGLGIESVLWKRVSWREQCFPVDVISGLRRRKYRPDGVVAARAVNCS